VRIALGAQKREVLSMVIGQALRTAGIGLGAGVVAALLLGGYLRTQLFGVQASDPTTIVLSMAVLAAVAVAASCIPAWRAASVDPLEALRME